MNKWLHPKQWLIGLIRLYQRTISARTPPACRFSPTCSAYAIEALERTVEAISEELPLEICCAEAENTMSALGELDGRTVSEDIVSRIFSNFCVGK